jgi:hypothetical protein
MAAASRWGASAGAGGDVGASLQQHYSWLSAFQHKLRATAPGVAAKLS